jgi:hypothetical protein
MAKLLRIQVAATDGTTRSYPLTPRVQIETERKFGKAFGKVFEEGLLESLYWVAWCAAHRSGEIVKPFEEWIDGVLSVEPEEDPASGPTTGTASNGG